MPTLVVEAEGIQAGVAGQRQLDHPRRERAPGGVVRALQGDPEQLGSRVLAVGILSNLSDAVDRDRVDTVDCLGVAVDGSPDELGLGVDVVACERETAPVRGQLLGVRGRRLSSQSGDTIRPQHGGRGAWWRGRVGCAPASFVRRSAG
jgi:hypothetical protein